mgnify:CR=1 FL=1|jgi:two-component system sensor histidine kinase RstB|tara:strand:+ start:79 stop:465 length:387 start_codon:yes stop_codon:yes gene_type:complete
MPEQAHTLIRAMDGYVDELDLLTDSVLALSKLKHRSTSLNFKYININQLVDERIQSIAPLNPDKKILRNAAKPFSAEVDQFFMQTIIDKILKNALYYCKNAVNINVINNDRHNLKIVVSDDGPGIIRR